MSSSPWPGRTTPCRVPHGGALLPDRARNQSSARTLLAPLSGRSAPAGRAHTWREVLTFGGTSGAPRPAVTFTADGGTWPGGNTDVRNHRDRRGGVPPL